MPGMKPAMIPAAIVSVLVSFGSAINATEPDATDWTNLVLRDDRPATRFEEAYPVGNGRFGAMCDGGTSTASLLLNHDRLWAGPPVPVPPMDASAALGNAIAAFQNGEPARGESILAERVLVPRISPRSHQPVGTLRLTTTIPGVLNVADPPALLRVTGWKRLDSEGAWVDAPAPEDRQVDPGRVVSFAAEFTLTPSLPGRIQNAGMEAVLALDPIDDASRVFVNDLLVGETSEWSKPSTHVLSHETLRAGVNRVVIEVTNIGGAGHGPADARVTFAPPRDECHRTLNMDTAVAETTWTQDGVQFERTVFASAVDDILVVRVKASGGSAVVGVDLSRNDGTSIIHDDHTITMRGRAKPWDQY